MFRLYWHKSNLRLSYSTQNPFPDSDASLDYRLAKRLLTQTFQAAKLPFAEEEAMDLILGLCGLSPTDYVLRGTDTLTREQIETLREATKRRLSGDPVDRILGWRDFYGRPFSIQNVLSPRGDTEVLLLSALDAVSTIESPRLLDLGTGSGALAITLLCEREDATAIATDIDDAAISTARDNAKNLTVSHRLTLLQSNWFDAIPTQSFHAILSNPPYITSRAMSDLEPEVANHDPSLALHGGEDGLDPYRQLIPRARDYLTPNGWLGVEIGFDQGDAVRALFESNDYSDIELLLDPAGHDRVVTGRMSLKS